MVSIGREAVVHLRINRNLRKHFNNHLSASKAAHYKIILSTSLILFLAAHFSFLDKKKTLTHILFSADVYI